MIWTTIPQKKKMAKPCKNKRSPYGVGKNELGRPLERVLRFFSSLLTQQRFPDTRNHPRTVKVLKSLALRDLGGRLVPRLPTQLGSPVRCETPIDPSHRYSGWLSHATDPTYAFGDLGQAPLGLFLMSHGSQPARDQTELRSRPLAPISQKSLDGTLIGSK